MYFRDSYGDLQERDPPWMDGPDCDPEYPCIDCQDKQDIIKSYKEDKVIAAKELSTVIELLYTNTTFDKVALNSAVEALCQNLEVDIPFQVLNVTRKKCEYGTEDQYFNYAVDMARRQERSRITKL